MRDQDFHSFCSHLPLCGWAESPRQRVGRRWKRVLPMKIGTSYRDKQSESFGRGRG